MCQGHFEINKNCNSRHFLSLAFVISSSISEGAINVDLPHQNPYCDSFNTWFLLKNDSNLLSSNCYKLLKTGKSDISVR